MVKISVERSSAHVVHVWCTCGGGDKCRKVKYACGACVVAGISSERSSTHVVVGISVERSSARVVLVWWWELKCRKFEPHFDSLKTWKVYDSLSLVTISCP